MARTWTIHPLCFGTLVNFERSMFTYNRNVGQKLDAPCIAWLLESNGEAILVDSGPPDGEAASRWHSKTTRTPEQAPDVALRAVGVDPSELRLVILTHLHWDHCYNTEMFPAARFLVQAAELRSAVDPVATQRGAYEVGMRGLLPNWLGVFDRLEVVRRDVEVAPGVQVVLLPGHAPGLQGVLVQTAKGPHLIGGDAVPLFENLGTDGGQVIAPGIHTDVALCLESIERARRLAPVVLPGHDPAVFRERVYPAE
jgi:N-acyl homoserine lactone hydrolase